VVGVKAAAEKATPNKDLGIERDSKYAIKETNEHRQRQEDEGYIKSANKEIIQATIAQIRTVLLHNDPQHNILAFRTLLASVERVKG